MNSENGWFTEYFASAGTSFGLKVKSKLHEEKSEYQHIEIYDTETFGKLMVIDGCVMLTSRDNFLYHEMMCHPALFTHENPEKVLIVGGGDCGTLREVLKHGAVKKAIQIDIDERVTRLSERYFPELCADNDDCRAELKFTDGIQWVASQQDDSVDVMIVDSTDPIGPAKGLFTRSFFEQCLRVLKPKGILVQQSESPLLHVDTIISDMHKHMKLAGFTECKTLPFPQPVYPSGWWSCTMASVNADLNSFRNVDAEELGNTLYYSAGIHRGALTLPPFMEAKLAHV